MKKAVVLGAYGFIGAACVRALQGQGYSVCGVGRSKDLALRTFPDLVWVFRDISTTSTDDWRDILGDADVVVNASGALQDGAKDNLKAIHEIAVSRIVEALTGTSSGFIQISAAGVSDDAPTPFLRTKSAGDKIIAGSKINWIILRPVLVLGPEAYGGSALLRASATMPFVELRVFEDAQVQTIHIDDLANAVALCASGDLGDRFSADLSEEGVRSFRTLTQKVRTWLGFPDWRHTVRAPDVLIKLLGKGADMLGWLGWRSPLRTNALLSLESGITAEGNVWALRGGLTFKSLEETLRHFAATSQERSFARLYLLMPVAIGCLALFWTLSGLIGFLSFGEAAKVLTERGTTQLTATVLVASGGVVDILLGCMVLVRRWTRRTCVGMILVSIAYLLGGTWFAPDLWVDPLGPLVKVLPAFVLAAMVALLLEER